MAAVRIFLAAGHGIKPDTTFDPGATFNGLIENDLARRVVAASVNALKRSGETSIYAESFGGAHDPNFVGSIKKANELPASRAAEIHFNAGGGTGVEVWVAGLGGEAEKWARAVSNTISMKLGLTNRGVKVNPNFSFLSKTNMPAILVEVAFVDGDNAKIKADIAKFCTNAGEAFVQGTLAYLGSPHYVAPSPTPTPPANPCAALEKENATLKSNLADLRAELTTVQSALTLYKSKVQKAKDALA